MALLLKHTSADNATQITARTWPDAFAGAVQAAEKFFVQNIGDRPSTSLALAIAQVGITDGSSMMRLGLDVATVLPPYGLAAALTGAGAGGVFGATGTYYYVLTAVNALGETVASLEASIAVDVTTKKVTLTWTPVANATGYKLYRATSTGVYGATTLRASISGQATATYTDDGDALSAGTPPVANTTGGAAPAYGTPPTLATTPLTLGVLEIGQWAAYWCQLVVPGGTDEIGNPRSSLRRFTET
jgi:hypothetical protein